MPLSVGRFRTERRYLADHVFLNVPGGGAPPSKLVDRKTWERIMYLPTDVLLRTTDYLGHMVSRAQSRVRPLGREKARRWRAVSVGGGAAGVRTRRRFRRARGRWRHTAGPVAAAIPSR